MSSRGRRTVRPVWRSSDSAVPHLIAQGQVAPNPEPSVEVRRHQGGDVGLLPLRPVAVAGAYEELIL